MQRVLSALFLAIAPLMWAADVPGADSPGAGIPSADPTGFWIPPGEFYAAPDRASAHDGTPTRPPATTGNVVQLDPGTTAAVGPVADSPGETADPAGAGDAVGDVAAREAIAASAETPREEPAIEIPQLAELSLEAFSVAPRGSEDEALIVAFYGHPRSKAMGILGEYPLPQMARKLMAVSKQYDDANGPQPVIPAFHIIYATVFENADVGILDEEILLRYIEFAEEHGFIVFIDHQLGKHDVVKSVRSMLPYLRYESVHLAIDPEWSTLEPGREIGSVTAREINESQRAIQDYLIEHDLPGTRMLVVHQFNWRMIEDRENVKTDFARVRLVHNADGFGPPAAKIRSWEYNLLAHNIPVKGFKLFYPKSWRNGGFDHPLMTVDDVMNLEPRPAVIMYQ